MENITICDNCNKWVVECRCSENKEVKTDPTDDPRYSDGKEYYWYMGRRYEWDGVGRVW